MIRLAFVTEPAVGISKELAQRLVVYVIWLDHIFNIIIAEGKRKSLWN